MLIYLFDEGEGAERERRLQEVAVVVDVELVNHLEQVGS